jgi:hypothetical protein
VGESKVCSGGGKKRVRREGYLWRVLLVIACWHPKPRLGKRPGDGIGLRRLFFHVRECVAWLLVPHWISPVGYYYLVGSKPRCYWPEEIHDTSQPVHTTTAVPRDGDKRGGEKGEGGSESRMGADHSHSTRLFASVCQPLPCPWQMA